MTTSLLDVRRGSQSPRVSTHPTYAFSSGPDVADLSEAAGLVLDPWQRFVLEHGLGERPDGKWAAREVACFVPRQNGKGAIIEARVLAGLFLFGERRILWSAHEYKTAQEGFLRIRELIQNAPDFDRLVKRYWEGSGEQGIELTTGQRLKFIARSKGSGRGFSGDLVILDEAQELTLLMMKALLPTLSARPNPQVWYFGTPPEDDAAWIYGVRKDGEAGKARLAYFDWGLGEIDLTVPLKERLRSYADMNLAYQTNPALGADRPSALTEEFCEDELSRLKEGYAPERLGMWLPYAGDESTGWQVISQAAWEAGLDADSAIESRPAYGVYVPPDRSYAAIGAAGTAAGGRHIEITGNDAVGLDYRPGTKWVVARLKELERHEPSALVIDDKALAEEAEKAGLTVHRANVTDVVTGCQALYDGIAGPDVAARDIVHIGQAELTDAVRGAVKRDVGGSWAWARRDLAVDVTPLAAASLALFGHSTPRVHRPVTSEPWGAWL